MGELNLIGNYAVAGTNKFISHIVKDNKKTYCGLELSLLRGQWESTGGETMTDVGCIRCRRAYRKISKNKLIRCSICGAELGFDEKLIPHNVNSCLVTLQAKVSALRARIEELTIPDEVLADLLEIVTSYCADREYFGKGYNWLTAYKEAQGSAPDAKGGE
jgi:hypothetical protein